MILYDPITRPAEGDESRSSRVQMENPNDSWLSEKELPLECQVDSPGRSLDLYHSYGDSI
jgi:hypothetical protein